MNHGNQVIPIFVIMMRKGLRTNFLKNCVIIENQVATFKILSEDAVQKSEKATFVKLCYPATADLLSPCQPWGGWGPCYRLQSETGNA